MLIELRSSETDSNNTPNHILQRFKETLILKPNSKVALVSALTTTFKSNAYTIDNNNNLIYVEIGSFRGRSTITLDNGSYSGSALASHIQSKIQQILVSQPVDLKNLFYPNSGIICSKNDSGFHLQVQYDPTGFTSDPVDIGNTTANTNVVVAGIGMSADASFAPYKLFYRNRDTQVSATQNTSTVIASHPILPYSIVAPGADAIGTFELKDFVKSNRPIQFNLDIASEIVTLDNALMDSVDVYQDGLGNDHYWDKFVSGDAPFGQQNYPFDYVITTVQAGLIVYIYVKKTDPYDGSTHVFDYWNLYVNPANVAKSGDVNLLLNVDGTALIGYNLGGVDYTTTENIPFRPTTQYSMTTERDTGDLQIRYGSTQLNRNTTSTVANGDSLRWEVRALDRLTPGNFYAPKPQVKRHGTTVWTDIPIDAGQVLPVYNETTKLIPDARIDGRLQAGCIGNGRAGNTGGSAGTGTTSFLASGMTISNKSVTTGWCPGELLYQVGVSAPAGGLGKVLMAVVGTNHIGGNTGDLTGVLVIGNGQDGADYAQNMVLTMRGNCSGNTCDITLTDPEAQMFTRTASGSGYTAGNAQLFLNNGVPHPPHPLLQTGRGGIHVPKPATININQTTGNGNIGTITILDGGFGFCIGDTVEVVQAGSDGLARFTIQQVAEDAQQFKIKMDTRNLDVAGFTDWYPLRPQNQGEIDTLADGNSTLGEELHLTPRVYTGDLSTTPQIDSNTPPPFNTNTNENIMINLVNVPINSRNAVGNTDNHIATIPYSTDINSNNADTNKQHYEPYNMINHSLENEADLNLNHIEMTLTDFNGKLREDLIHPTQITLSITPDSK